MRTPHATDQADGQQREAHPDRQQIPPVQRPQRRQAVEQHPHVLALELPLLDEKQRAGHEPDEERHVAQERADRVRNDHQDPLWLEASSNAKASRRAA